MLKGPNFFFVQFTILNYDFYSRLQYRFLNHHFTPFKNIKLSHVYKLFTPPTASCSRSLIPRQLNSWGLHPFSSYWLSGSLITASCRWMLFTLFTASCSRSLIPIRSLEAGVYTPPAAVPPAASHPRASSW